MSNSSLNKMAELEAFLFYHGESVCGKRIASALKISQDEVAGLIGNFRESCAGEGRGVTILEKGGKFQIITKPELGFIFENLIKEELTEKLTPAALETLSIVAYLGPLTRAEVDYIRGVNSSFMIRNLVLRGLVERERGKQRGAFYEYSVGFDFLKHIGLEDARELPEYDKYREVLQNFRSGEIQ